MSVAFEGIKSFFCKENRQSRRLLKKLSEDVIGEGYPIQTPFGIKPLVYMDYTASGRALQAVEEFIRQRVMPFYANTHTETSYTGAQTTLLREQARSLIKQSLHANDNYALIFCGAGATSAIVKLMDILNLRVPPDLDERYGLRRKIPHEERPVVFIGPYEHHSNELPWRESIAELVTIPMTAEGLLDIDYLEQQLQQYQDRRLLLGSFSAASNVTGIKTDINQVSLLLHRYGALACWDYAAAGPYLCIDVRGAVQEAGGCLRKANGSLLQDAEGSIDALFLSPHKFVGGPGTPGILLVKKGLMKNRVPVVPGGGTVDFVTPDEHHYTRSEERREEGGTPAIIESIRAGLVFTLQQKIGCKTIEQLEASMITRSIARWRRHQNIRILGSDVADRLAIVSFVIEHHTKQLHYGYVVALLNDLFGIQARGGCSCAGPYGHWLLDIDRATSRAFVEAVDKGNLLLRPGWVRLNFNYFTDQYTFEYVVQAVEMIAEHGWKLLPYYAYDKAANRWLYQAQKTEPEISLANFDPVKKLPRQKRKIPSHRFKGYLDLAMKEFSKTRKRQKIFALNEPLVDNRFRWFVLPQECIATEEAGH